MRWGSELMCKTLSFYRMQTRIHVSTQQQPFGGSIKPKVHPPTHLLSVFKYRPQSPCKLPLLLVTRWVLSWLALRLLLTNIRDYIDISFSSSDVDSLEQSTSPLPLGSSSSKVIRDCLNSTTFGDITERRLPADQNSSCDSDTSSTTCAVCLEGLKKQDPVRELGNCCHLFHRRCLDTWLDHDSHQTCPLCRAPLLSTTTIFSSSSSAGMSSQQQPSWTVERILYLFGDDLLP